MHTCGKFLQRLNGGSGPEHYGINTGGHEHVHRAAINQQSQQSAIRCRRNDESRIIIAIARPKFDDTKMYARPLGAASPPSGVKHRDLLGRKTEDEREGLGSNAAPKFRLATEYPDLTGRFRVSEWRPDTTSSRGTSPAVTAVPAPRVNPDTSLPLSHRPAWNSGFLSF